MSREELDSKLSEMSAFNISVSHDDYQPGDIVEYSCRKDDGGMETHVFEINAVKEVKISAFNYLGCVD
jgi:hypothetical protein